MMIGIIIAIEYGNKFIQVKKLNCLVTEAKRISRNINNINRFGKSYLIPETTNYQSFGNGAKRISRNINNKFLFT